MIIKSLTIENIRNYVGPSTFNLSTTQDKNILLIGGENGAGKTSFADSIRLCLYGKYFAGEVMSEAKYQEYIGEICNKRKEIEHCSVSMKIVMDEENPPIEIDITRKFIKKHQGFEEKLILKRGDSDVEIIDEDYWSYYIKKLIPPQFLVISSLMEKKSERLWHLMSPIVI